MGAIDSAAAQIEQAVAQPPADVQTGDDGKRALEPVAKLLDVMSPAKWGTVYERWKQNPFCGHAVSAWKGSAAGTDDAERVLLPQLETINWGYMWGLRGRLGSMATVGGHLTDAMTQAKNGLNAVWKGAAADAAMTKFDQAIGGADGYQKSNARLAGALEGTWHATRTPVLDLGKFAAEGPGAEFVRKWGDEKDFGNWNFLVDELSRMAAFGFSSFQHLLAEVRSAGMFGVTPQGLEVTGGIGPSFPQFPKGLYRLYEVISVVTRLDEMAMLFGRTITQLRQRIRETHDTVEKGFQQLEQATKDFQNGWGGNGLSSDPFAKLAPPAGGPGEKRLEKEEVDHKKSEEKNGGGGGGGPNSGGGGGPNSGGGGGPTSSAYQPPPLPSGETPDASGQNTDPAGAGDSLTDPSSPVPDPSAAAQQPEKVTIKDGDRTISVESPDGQGHVKVTVDDGSGKPKTYDLQFDPTAPGAAGETGNGPARQTDPSMSSLLSGTGGQEGAAGSAGQPDVQHAQAGPDGKVVLKDGETTITAERPPGSPDQVRLTIDDGTGAPKSYILDYQDPASPQVVDQAGSGQVDSAQSNSGQSAASVAPQMAYQDVPRQADVSSAQDFAYQESGSEPSVDHAAAGSTEPVQSTSAQGLAFPSADGAAGLGSADAFTENNGLWTASGDLLGDVDDQQTGAAGAAGLAGLPPDDGQQHAPAGGPAGGAMPMMGGMGAGGGGGGDQTRSGGGMWRTEGDLFSDEYSQAAARISDMLTDEQR